jgi:Heparinase II/III-like protein/Heparinase II/III N-terminus
VVLTALVYTVTRMGIVRKIKRAVRGEVKPKTIVLEAWRRTRASREARHERNNLDRLNSETPKLKLSKTDDLLSHFRSRTEPHFFAGFSDGSVAKLQTEFFPRETEALLTSAHQILDEHSWNLLGFGARKFGAEIQWRRDPLSGYIWPLDYHRDIQLIRHDGSDARVLWELNRLGHLLTLARAYVVTGDKRFSKECVAQLQSWVLQNPYGRGINWTSAMEVALRAINLLAVFELIKNSVHFDADTLQLFLQQFHQHGTYICKNLEFTHLSTSNHYLSDVAGLLWLGIMLPEFVDSKYFFDLGLGELLTEMDKQVLADGADFESSTGYHRYVLELLLYSFILCKQNDIEIEDKYWPKLRLMVEYLKSYLRPDGLAPLIGDSDGGQVLPLCRRRADEHSYVLAIGAAMFPDSKFLIPNIEIPCELLWLLGQEGVKTFRNLPVTHAVSSSAFPDVGTYVMRKDDLYLCFNASGAGLNGRGSHGHNDALSIEVSARERPLIIDPGTYVYTADLKQRHLFRSTSYHSTVKIDGEEQNSTGETLPFVIGDEAHPRVLQWQTNDESDKVVAEHSGYARLSSPVVHRRTVVFDKIRSWWLIEDEFLGDGDHDYEVRFHFAPDLVVKTTGAAVTVSDGEYGLIVSLLDVKTAAVLETQASSRDYGEKTESITACWHFAGKPGKLRWKIEIVDGQS